MSAAGVALLKTMHVDASRHPALVGKTDYEREKKCVNISISQPMYPAPTFSAFFLINGTVLVFHAPIANKAVTNAAR
jgi:hypothetical protein